MSVSLVKIHLLVQKIEGRQKVLRTPTGSAPKALLFVPLLPLGGHNFLPKLPEPYIYFLAQPLLVMNIRNTTESDILISFLTKDLLFKTQFLVFLTLICRVDYSIIINWTSPFLFLGVADVLFSFSSYLL